MTLALASASAWQRLRASDVRAMMTVGADKTADESVTSSVTLQNDDELALVLPAGMTYTLAGLLIITGAAAAGGMAVAFTWPGTATAWWTVAGLAVSGGANFSAVRTVSGGSLALGTSGTGTPVPGYLRGKIQTGSATCTLQLQFAQSASNATATTMKAGSAIEARPR